MKSEKIFLVKESVLLHLLERDLFLDYLETAGVDNWCGFGEGISEYLADKAPKAKEEIDFEYLARLNLSEFREYITDEDDLK